MGYALRQIAAIVEKSYQMKKILFMIVGFALMSLILAVLYRSANNSELPDDEWFEFENLST
jgi:hypothetical protein